MRSIIFGGIGVLWGGAILVWTFIGGLPKGGGARAAGEWAGVIFGLLLFVVGGYYLYVGIRGAREDAAEYPREGKRRSKKRKRPGQDVEAD